MMAHGVEKPRDVVGGLLIVAIGAGFFLFERELEMGSSFRMGPGYFPTIFSLLMVTLGSALTVLTWRSPSEGGPPVARAGAVVGAVVRLPATGSSRRSPLPYPDQPRRCQPPLDRSEHRWHVRPSRRRLWTRESPKLGPPAPS